MNIKKIALTLSMTLGMVSFICLIAHFLALTEIWHTQGQPDFWHGQGPSNLEWRVLGYAYWPMLTFHIVFLVTTGAILINNSQPSPPNPATEEKDS